MERVELGWGQEPRLHVGFPPDGRSTRPSDAGFHKHTSRIWIQSTTARTLNQRPERRCWHPKRQLLNCCTRLLWSLFNRYRTQEKDDDFRTTNDNNCNSQLKSRRRYQPVPTSGGMLSNPSWIFKLFKLSETSSENSETQNTTSITGPSANSEHSELETATMPYSSHFNKCSLK